MALEQHIKSLQDRRAALKLQIHSEMAHAGGDDMLVHRLKQENLKIKDEIVGLLRRSDHLSEAAA